MSEAQCPCNCHGGPGAFRPACSVPGGCGPHDDTAESQPCARGPSCTARVKTVDGQWQGGPATRDLCGPCEADVADALEQAPRLWRQLRKAARDRVRGAALGERVSTSPGRSFGLNGHPLWLADTLLWTVTGWAAQVLATAGRPSCDRTRQPEAGQVDDCCALLGDHLSVWLAHRQVVLHVTADNPDPEDPKADPTGDTVTITQSGWEACAWLADWHRQAEKALGLDLLTHWLPEPCPQCDVPGVCRRRDGGDKVHCTNCGKAWTLKTWETFVHAWLAGAAAPEEPKRRGPGSAVGGQDARRGASAHSLASGEARLSHPGV